MYTGVIEQINYTIVFIQYLRSSAGWAAATFHDPRRPRISLFVQCSVSLQGEKRNTFMHAW